MKKRNRHKIYTVLRRFVDPIFKKDKKKVIIFASTGVLDSNLQCVKAYLEYYHLEKKVVVVFAKNKYPLKRYINILLAFFTSYYIVVDHAIPRFITNKNRKIFNTWHGIPLKTIRHLDKKRFTDKFLEFESKNVSGLACSSDLDRAVMAACFNIPPNKCVLSGLPRADILTSSKLDWFQDPQEPELVSLLKGRKLVAWMPTYRGTWHERNVITAFDEKDQLTLCKLLKKHNAVFGIRPHKFSELQEFQVLEKEDLLVDLSKFSVTNTVLKHTHHLITDYSSVWLDYSLISNNISLFLFDNEEYNIERGMIYPLSEVFPGLISSSFEEIHKDIDTRLSTMNADFEPSRLFFKYTDSENTQRFVEAMLNEI